MLPGAGFAWGLTMRGAGLQNLAYPLRSVQGTVTPSRMFFVRDHFEPPKVSLETWSLRVEGRVQHSYALGFSDLVELPSRKLEAVLECAGNGANGSAVSNGVWEGVPISVLLATAHPASDASSVLLEGADRGHLLSDRPLLPYSQVVPMKKCLDPSSLVAYKLNDLALPKRNGFPARALLAGWYGMDSVKWLQRIVVLGPGDRDTVFEKSGMNREYNRLTRQNGHLRVARVSSVKVKSAIAWPSDASKIPAGRYSVWGFAWSGSAAIDSVLVTTNSGKRWDPATLSPHSPRYGWTRWSYPWNARPGEYNVMSRATDRNGNQQPLRRDPTRKDTYELDWCAPVHCTVG